MPLLAVFSYIVLPSAPAALVSGSLGLDFGLVHLFGRADQSCTVFGCVRTVRLFLSISYPRKRVADSLTLDVVVFCDLYAKDV